MIRLRAFGVALFWALSCQGVLAADGCPLRLTTVKTASLADGRIKIPVMLEGHPLSFLLDTGGISTTIKWEQAREMGLPVKQSLRKLAGVGGSMLNFTITAENFSI